MEGGENREGEFERIGFQGIGESVQGTLLHSCHSASLFHFKIFNCVLNYTSHH